MARPTLTGHGSQPTGARHLSCHPHHPPWGCRLPASPRTTCAVPARSSAWRRPRHRKAAPPMRRATAGSRAREVAALPPRQRRAHRLPTCRRHTPMSEPRRRHTPMSEPRRPPRAPGARPLRARQGRRRECTKRHAGRRRRRRRRSSSSSRNCRRSGSSERSAPSWPSRRRLRRSAGGRAGHRLSHRGTPRLATRASASYRSTAGRRCSAS